MIKIYKLNPEPIFKGSFNNGILEINNKKIKMTEEEIIKIYNRGYWRCGRE